MPNSKYTLTHSLFAQVLYTHKFYIDVYKLIGFSICFFFTFLLLFLLCFSYLSDYHFSLSLCTLFAIFTFFMCFVKFVQELKELQCRNCNIKKINPQVYNLLQRLQYLDLGDNQVCYVSVFFANFSPFLEFVSITEKLCSFFYHFFRLCVAPSSIQRQLQLKYLEKGEFRDLNSVKSIRLDGNQLSVIIDNLFETQKYLEFLGKCWWLVDCIHAIHAHKRKHKWLKNSSINS